MFLCVADLTVTECGNDFQDFTAVTRSSRVEPRCIRARSFVCLINVQLTQYHYEMDGVQIHAVVIVVRVAISLRINCKPAHLSHCMRTVQNITASVTEKAALSPSFSLSFARSREIDGCSG